MKRRITLGLCSMAFLLVAGCSEPEPVSSWVSVGALLEARSGHSATRLSDGSVLFVGGENAQGTLATAEVYVTSRKQWSKPQSNGAPRARHTSVKLPDGRVLSIGGTNNAAAPCVEFYNPTDRTFTADMSWAGDCPGEPVGTWVPSSKRFVIVGGMGPIGALQSVKAYDFATNVWSPLADMAVARTGHTATFTEDGLLLVTGGGNESAQALDSAERYDFDNEKWITLEAMAETRRDHTATLFEDGKILVVGGHNENGVLSSVEKCQCNEDPDTKVMSCQWMTVGSLHHARYGHTATVLNDRHVLVTGGTDENGQSMDSVELFDPATNEFVEIARMSSARREHTATWLADGSVLVAGGANASGPLATAERFVPADAGIPCQDTAECPHAMVCGAELVCVQSEGPLSSQPTCSYAPKTRSTNAMGGLFAVLLGAWAMRRKRLSKRMAASCVAGATLLVPSLSQAQTPTFYLDRLTIAGGADDGTAVWRPVFGRTGAFGQVAFGYARDPLRTGVFVDNSNQRRALVGSAVSLQMTAYATFGIELAKRGAVQVTLPYVVQQRGYPTDARTVGLDQVVVMSPSAIGDLRLDGRMLVLWNDSRSFTLAARVAAYLPTGDETSFTGEGHGWGNVGLSAEYNADAFFLTANAGFTLRPRSSLVDLNVGSELAYAVGVFIPLKHDRVRLGAEFWGNLGLLTVGDPVTIPIEAAVSGRMAFGASKRVFLGITAGGRIGPGYAPDMRFVARIGGTLPFEREQVEPSLPVRIVPEADTDGDGFVDGDDKCPTVKEDFLREKEGCPETDEDNDGIVTSIDACPKVPEDKDGLADDDGCPEDDFDGDGFVDVDDKCPKEPGVRNVDPTKVGCPQFIVRTETEVRLFKQVDFEFRSATITRGSYPILDEIAKLLVANPDIKQLRIEGHTDNVGDAPFNQDLSVRRAEAVREYLVKRGKVNASRLTVAGFGQTKPIAPNDTEAGRAKNRRVELQIGAAAGGGEKKP